MLRVIFLSLLLVSGKGFAQCFTPEISCVQYDYIDNVPYLVNNTERLLDYIARNITGGGGGGGGLATEATLQLVADATSEISADLYNEACSSEWMQTIHSDLFSPNAPLGQTCNPNYSLLNLMYTEWSATLADSLALTNQILRGIGSGGSTTGLATEATLNDVKTNTTGLATQATLSSILTGINGIYGMPFNPTDLFTINTSLTDLRGSGLKTLEDITTGTDLITDLPTITEFNAQLIPLNTSTDNIESDADDIRSNTQFIASYLNNGAQTAMDRLTSINTSTTTIATQTTSSATSNATTATQTTTTATNTGTIATNTTTLNNNSAFTTVSTGALGAGGFVDYSNANGAPISQFSFTITSAPPATYTILILGANDNTVAAPARWVTLKTITNATAATATETATNANIQNQCWKYISFRVAAVAAGTITSTVVWKSNL